MTKVVVVCSSGIGILFAKEMIGKELSELGNPFSLDDIEIISEDDYILGNHSSNLKWLDFYDDLIKLDDFNFVDGSSKTNYFEREKSLRFLNKKRKNR